MNIKAFLGYSWIMNKAKSVTYEQPKGKNASLTKFNNTIYYAYKRYFSIEQQKLF
jgi:hypothetical protein